MSESIAATVKEEVAKYINQHSNRHKKLPQEIIGELIQLGFEQRLREVYAQYERGEISLGWLGNELGLNLREVYELLETRRLPLSPKSTA